MMEEEDICCDFFNHIDDLLDFPVESLDIAGDADLLPAEAQPGQDRLWVADGGAVASSPPFSDDDLAAGLAVPMEDIAELEWLSTFVEDSFAAGSVDAESKLLQKDARFRTASPVSVLESSPAAGKPGPLAAVAVPGRARSKRPRPASFFPRPLLSPDSFAAAHSKKRKPPPPPPAAAGDRAAGVRKCMHCEITKTPQWRAGPMGPKTLCNACGVRYKSGRLFPEYRPAASPTFVSAVHSNSHKKVVEMRTKSGKKEPAPVPYFVRKNNSTTVNIISNNRNDMALLDCNVHI